jgi:uncharacterized membrane protein
MYFTGLWLFWLAAPISNLGGMRDILFSTTSLNKDTRMQSWMFFYMGGGFLLAAFALPMVRRKKKPGRLAIFPQSGRLEDQDQWYKANEYAGCRLLTVGLGTALTAFLLYVWPGLDLSEQEYILAVTAVLGGLLLWAILTSYLFYKSL